MFDADRNDEKNEEEQVDGSNTYKDEYIPVPLDHSKPYIGRKFGTLKEAEDFYRSYGAACGFDVRLGQIKKSSDGIIIIRYVYCNREGMKSSSSVADGLCLSKRKKKICTRVSCKARVIFRYCGREGYVVDVFKEGHTHAFVSNNHTHFLKCNRYLDDVHQNFILNCAKANIGPMRSFRLFKEIVGSYNNVGCSGLEFKNFSRDLNAYVDGVDAQMLLDKFHNKREIFPDFTFDYSVNDSGKLTRLFWADSLSIKMFHSFGEAVSFDATYSTNKYGVMFFMFFN